MADTSTGEVEATLATLHGRPLSNVPSENIRLLK